MGQNIFVRNKGCTAFGIIALVAIVTGTVLAIVFTRSSDEKEVNYKRQFTIDHKEDTFMKDGKPFQYVAGSYHYFRAMPETWREKLRTMRAGGLNVVDLYIQWSLHNPKDGVYNWDGIADVERVVQIATEEDLLVILRPGPYICAEIDNGGLPYWLATKYPNIKVRTSDADYLREVERWYSKLMPQFEKHMYGNGGNIIMVQIENEYGAFKACDVGYKNFLRDETLKYTKDHAILFTTDRPIDKEIECGYIENVFVTTDFGLANRSQVESHFQRLREVQPTGPLVNTEFYTGWLTHWQEDNARRSAKELAETLDYMLMMKVNVDFYMYFGGTNFGFWAGANDWGIGKYMADITSYDYDAPMDEAGNPTDKYLAFREVIAKYINLPQNVEIPMKKPTMSLTSVNLKAIDSILSADGRRVLGSRSFSYSSLPTFEELDQFSGFVLYETPLPELTRDPSKLTVTGLRDRAHIFVDSELIGILSRENLIDSIPIHAGYGSKLSILVENQGRINFQIADDYKGIIGNVQIQAFDANRNVYKILKDWTITGFGFDNFASIENFVRTSNTNYQVDATGNLYDGPVLFYNEFYIDESQPIADTYWDCEGWGKGFLYVNGFNLGRYWPLVGPQITIYIPKELLRHGTNEIHVIELQKAPVNLRMNFVNGPIFINDKKN